MKKVRRALASLAAFLIVASVNAYPAPPAISIVLVHGALVDGSSWRGVYGILTKDGYRVRVVQPPLTGLDQDVAATKRVLDLLEGPIVLVGNSYGGTIITVAGSDPKVKALVYVAALQPDVGETSAEAAPPKHAASDALVATKDGFVFLDTEKFAADLGADLSATTADFMAHAQMPILGAAFNTQVTTAAWHDKPSYVIIATADRELDETSARRMASRARSKVSVIKGGHLVFISQPEAVAKVIERAAREIK